MAHTAAERPPEETLSLWKGEQARLKARVVDRDTEAWQRDPSFSGLQKVGGVDVSFVKGDSVRACASLVVLSYPELKVVYEDSRMVGLKAPYVSGFLAFREVPFLVELVQRLQEKEPDLMPQVVLVDGNGVLHQRGFGVACHLGVLTELPCIGVAKKLLQVDGLENNALHKEKIVLLQAGGDTFPLIGSSGTVLGMALRSHDHSTKPLYVSVGHRISLEVAVRLTHHCCRFRIPEPIRQVQWSLKPQKAFPLPSWPSNESKSAMHSLSTCSPELCSPRPALLAVMFPRVTVVSVLASKGAASCKAPGVLESRAHLSHVTREPPKPWAHAERARDGLAWEPRLAGRKGIRLCRPGRTGCGFWPIFFPLAPQQSTLPTIPLPQSSPRRA